MTTLYIPTGDSIEIEEADISRLAFEYRNCRDKPTLDAIAAELEKRDADAAELRRVLGLLREALRQAANDLESELRDRTGSPRAAAGYSSVVAARAALAEVEKAK